MSRPPDTYDSSPNRSASEPHSAMPSGNSRRTFASARSSSALSRLPLRKPTESVSTQHSRQQSTRLERRGVRFDVGLELLEGRAGDHIERVNHIALHITTAQHSIAHQ